MIKQQQEYLALWTRILRSQPKFIQDKIYEAHKETPTKAIGMMVINMTVRKELQGIFDK